MRHPIPRLAAVLALGPFAAAQSAFRPLPELPSFDLDFGAPLPALPSEFDRLMSDSEQPASEGFVELELLAAAAAARDLEGNAGTLATQRGGWRATLGERVGDETRAALELSTEASFYDFGGAASLGAGAPLDFNDLYRASASGTVAAPLASRGEYYAGASLELGGEDDADARDALTVGGVAGWRTDASDPLSVALGVAARSRLEDDPWIWPFVGFEWRVAPWLELGGEGTRFEARADLGGGWRALGRVEYELRQFRLNDDNPLPAGVLRDEEIRFAAGIERATRGGARFELVGGLQVWREISLLDGDGRALGEAEVDPAPFVALAISASF